MTYEDALILAAEAHRGQRDKAGEPYVRHVVRVAERMDSDEARLVALLHDVIEDTGRGPEELRREGVPDDVVERVLALSRRDGEGYEEFIERIRSRGDDVVRAVKLADIADNLDRLESWAAVAGDETIEPYRERYERARDVLLAR